MRRLQIVAMVGAAALALGGCSTFGSVYDTPLPGGADLGSHPITIHADFDDVLDLVPQSSVKVDNVAVGRVSSISLADGGRAAHVELKVNGDVELPPGTTARLKQTSLLGEKYVALIRPEQPVPGASLTNGAKLGLVDTSQSAQVEEVLGALSLVLNGGDIGQFQEISRELQDISTDRPEDVKAFLVETTEFVTGLDDRKQAITAALDGLDALSENLATDKSKIAKALDGLSPGMQVVVDQRKQLVSMLKALDRLSTVTVDTLDAAQKDIVADFKALEPILDQLAKSGSDLPNSLQILLTYPFPDSVLGAIKGDYLNVFITTNFRTLPSNCGAIGCSWPQANGATVTSNRSFTPKKTVAEPVEPPPTFLPPTSSPMPGIPEPTIAVPTPDPTTPAPSEPAPSQTTSPTPSTGAPKDGDN